MRTSFVVTDSLAASPARKGVEVPARVLVSEVMQGKTVLFLNGWTTSRVDPLDQSTKTQRTHKG